MRSEKWDSILAPPTEKDYTHSISMYARSLSALAFATDGKASHKIKHRKIPSVHVAKKEVARYGTVFKQQRTIR